MSFLHEEERYNRFYFALITAAAFIASLFLLLHLSVMSRALETPVQLSVPDTSLRVTGVAARGAQVIIYRNNVEIASTTADNQANFAITIGSIPTGTSNIGISYTDKQGRGSSRVTRNLAFQSQNQTNLEVFLPPTISAGRHDSFVSNQVITFRGSTAPKAEVTVVGNGNSGEVLLRTVANSAGRFMVNASASAFGVGEHSFYVYAEKNGSTSETSALTQFVVRQFSAQPTPPPEPIVDEAAPVSDTETRPSQRATPPTPEIISPVDGSSTSQTSVPIIGTSQPNSQIILYKDGVVAGSVFSDGDGSWQMVLTATRQQHQLYAIACLEDACSEPSATIDIAFRTVEGTCVLDVSLAQYRFWSMRIGEPIEVIVEHEQGGQLYTNYVDWGDGTSERFSAEGSARYVHTYQEAGIYNGVITIIDANGCSAARYFSVQVLALRPLQLSDIKLGYVFIGGLGLLFGVYGLTRWLIVKL